MTAKDDQEQGANEANTVSARSGVKKKRAAKTQLQGASNLQVEMSLDRLSGTRESDRIPGHTDASALPPARLFAEVPRDCEMEFQVRVSLRTLSARATPNRRGSNTVRRIAAPATSSDTPHSRLRFLREAKGYRTPEAFAAASKMDPKVYRRYEAGKEVITPARAQLFAQILGFEPGYILCESPKRPPIG